jgi:hypothetical protein
LCATNVRYNSLDFVVAAVVVVGLLLSLTLLSVYTPVNSAAIQTITNTNQIPTTTLTPLPSEAKPAPKFTELLDANASSPVSIEGDTQKYVATTGTLHIEALLVNNGNSDVNLVDMVGYGCCQHNAKTLCVAEHDCLGKVHYCKRE